MCCVENRPIFNRGCRRAISDLNKKFSLVLQEFGQGTSDLTQSNLIDPLSFNFSEDHCELKNLNLSKTLPFAQGWASWKKDNIPTLQISKPIMSDRVYSNIEKENLSLQRQADSLNHHGRINEPYNTVVHKGVGNNLFDSCEAEK